MQLDDDSRGYLQEINNIVNTTVVSNDPNVFKAEYEAGFMQGQLQKDSIPAGRDNSWDGSYLTDPSHSFPKQLPPSADELAETARTLRANWEYTLDYIRRAKGDVKQNLHRMVYRLVGIYDGATKDQPQAVAFDDAWYPSFSDAEMQATYETPGITFMDLYYLNTTGDLMDVLPGAAVPAPETVAPTSPATASPGTVVPTPTPGTTSPASSKCSAFVKITDSDIYVATTPGTTS